MTVDKPIDRKFCVGVCGVFAGDVGRCYHTGTGLQDAVHRGSASIFGEVLRAGSGVNRLQAGCG